MDGVLFDTERLCMEGWSAVAKAQGIDDMERVATQCIGLNETDTRALVCKHYGKDFSYEVFRKQVSVWFWKEIEKNGLPVKTGVRELLDFLKGAHYQIGLASSTRQESVRKHLQNAQIEEYFSVVITGDKVEHSKPEPDIYLLACEGLQVEPAKAYAIEDSPNGIRSAYAAGMKPIMVPDLIKPDREMHKLSHVILPDLQEVKRFLMDNGKR
ncbi:MAG: HAD family phosphatase [Lachnospiraceae bacterium]|nr:HAD family phosphatase [Lachnospiraceae bacterium]